MGLLRKSSSSVPAWMVTFADLMALMMTFFVLLYSFSKVDAGRYKAIVESMARGFGAQWIERVDTNSGVMGPKPGVIQPPDVRVKPEKRHVKPKPGPEPRPVSRSLKSRILDQLRNRLAQQLDQGNVQVIRQKDRIMLRFTDKVAFTSGSVSLSGSFRRILGNIAPLLEQSRSRVLVEGHTDNVPIRTTSIADNWELSARRAISVIRYLQAISTIPGKRITVIGYGDSRPLVANDTPANRARNRRVEISLFMQDRK